MNFWSDSVKLTTPTQSENFYLDLETPRGHFFGLLDFAPHDYANLDATLKRKLETIVESFDSVSKFSTDLFLGFLAKEINNFLYDLGKQSDSPPLFSSAALCLVSGNRLSYFLCGDIQLNILDGRRLHSLAPSRANGLRGPGGGGMEVAGDSSQPHQPNQFPGEAQTEVSDELGVRHWHAPLTERVPIFTLNDDDVVLMTTSGAAEMFEQPEFSRLLQSMRLSDPKSISDAFMENSSASLDDLTVLVITGPYDPFVDPMLTDLSKAFDSLDARVNAIAESGQRMGAAPDHMEKALETELEQRINPQFDELKDALGRKANSIDVLELNEILKNLGLVLATKADSTELLSLQRDILKLGIGGNENYSQGSNGSEEGKVQHPRPLTEGANRGRFLTLSGHDESNLLEGDDRIGEQIPRQTLFGLKTAVLVFVVAIGAAFIGAWLQSRILQKNPEVWAVKASGNQIWINRMDQGGEGNVTLNLAAPLRSRGEQTFSSFADVKRYVDTITVAQPVPDQTTQVAQQTQTVEDQRSNAAPKMVAKADDSTKPSSHADKIVSRKSPELNATAGNKPENKTLNKKTMPSAKSPSSAATLKRDRRVLANSVAVTSQVKVRAGDTLEKLARRYKTTSGELRKLNPGINERAVIRPNQKILVPASSPNDSKGRRVMLVKQTH